MNNKKTKRFLLSSACIILALAVFILINLIFTNLDSRFDLNIDLTEGKMYSISQDSYDILKKLDKPVSVTVLLSEKELDENHYGSYVKILMEKYADASDKLSLKYIDPYKNPSAVDSYSSLADNVAEGSIIIQSGKRSRVLNLIDFYDTSSDSSSGYTYVSAFKGENALTSAVLAVTSKNTPAAYILQGHNESVSNSFTDMLETSGYNVGKLTLSEKNIPKKTSLLVISLPQVDFTEAELNRIDGYVKNGGDLLVFTGTDSPSNLKNLYSYLSEWGINVNHDMILDSDYNISDARYILASLDDSDINANLSPKSDQIIVTPNARSLTAKLDEHVTDRTVQSILSSEKTSYSRKTEGDNDYDSYKKEKTDKDGPFTIATLSDYTENDKGGQVMVCSSALMMTDQLMQSSTLLNKNFLSNTVSQVQPEVNLISIPSKSMNAEPLTFSSNATYVVFVILLCIPIVLFAMGIWVFFERRKL